MTMSAPHCSCDDSWFPSMGRPCPIHGSKSNRDEMERLRARVATMDADAADYAAMAEAELSRLRAENERLSVSRVEYDAALARVREASLRCRDWPFTSRCKALTLAALDLDEPPTETPKADTEPARGRFEPNRMRPGYCWNCGSRQRDHAEVTFSCPRPVPTEPPKACPTCENGWTYHHACPDRGSGIDGGTAT